MYNTCTIFIVDHHIYSTYNTVPVLTSDSNIKNLDKLTKL